MKYDFTWYDGENLALVKDIPNDTLADLWLHRFGTSMTSTRIALEDNPAFADPFYRAATVRLLMDGWMIKEVGLETDTVQFRLKEYAHGDL